MTTLDPTNPLVLDTRALGRRAGAMITVARSFAAPRGWSVATCAVEPGSEVDLQVRLEGVVEGVLVSGRAVVRTTAECSRCLDEVSGTLAVDLQQLFEYPDLAARLPGEATQSEPLPALQGDLIDLEPTVRDAVVLDLPLVPLCSDDCPGLCATCGARLADDPGHHHREQDDRWAALQALLTSTDHEPVAGAGPEPTDMKGD